MKYLLEYNMNYNKLYSNDINYNIKNLDENIKLKIYEILSESYIHINKGIDTFLQLCGCISYIYIYINKNKVI